MPGPSEPHPPYWFAHAEQSPAEGGTDAEDTAAVASEEPEVVQGLSTDELEHVPPAETVTGAATDPNSGTLEDW